MTQTSDEQDELGNEQAVIEKEIVEVETAVLPDPETSPSLELQEVMSRINNLEKTVAHLATNITQLSERTNLIPRQVRQLGSKVDDVTESISQPRVRDLLQSILLLYDLVDQMGRSALETDDAHNYQVLRDQLLQILAVNGISQIPTDGTFDPALHKAVETVPCETPDKDGWITQVYRPGFQNERAILRYAEVIVNRHQSSDHEVRELGESNET